MPSERVQRRVERLLDQIDEAEASGDWTEVEQLARDVLGVDPENGEAAAYLESAQRRLGGSPSPQPSPAEGRGGKSEVALLNDDVGATPTRRDGTTPVPTSFANDRYQVSKFLGEGGKKRVFQAHDTLLDREVAFALIKTEGFDQTSKERISREAQAMGRLGVHPNIVAVLDLGQEDDGSPYMVTELMGGGDIEGVLDESEESRLSLERTIEIGKAVCEGLEFAHARGIVHRDLKPGNVWLTEDGTAKIGDFGLAMLTDRSRLTREAMMIGTVSYMPPEQATGGDITPRADLYSLGAMLYEMVTGRPPFLGDDEIAIIGQHINTPPVAPTWHNGTCPRPLEALIMRLLSKDPSERPDSAQDVFNALDTIDLTARGETVERDVNSLESLAGGVFVGRQAEMDQLKSALEDVLGGRGRLVTLVGEPGIGKTRTSEELATYAGLRGAQVLWGRCYEGGGAPPYWPWVQAIRSYVRDLDSDELRRQMGSSASVVAEIVTDVKDRMPELQPPPQMDDPQSARFRLFDSITSFLKTASQSQPLVIVLDDLHWSDQPSLTFLEFISRELNQSRVLVLCTYRDMELNRRHPLSVTLGDLARERLYERVLLRGLTQDDIARFVEIAAGFTAPAELSATVQRHTEGNPLFVTEVIRDLVQSGELTEEKVSGRSSWSVRIPEGVREVIGRRLDRLSDRANETFTIAAVIGREFTLAALRELAEDTTEGQLLDVLDEALDAKLIEELPDEIGHYQFTHALIQETLTSELSSARTVRLHARIAETLERVYGDAANEHAAELVPHFVEAELVLGVERSIHYSTIAGEQSLAMIDPQGAADHFEHAVSLYGDGELDARKARSILGLGRARHYIGAGHPDAQLAFDTMSEALEFYVADGDSDTVAEIALEPGMNSGRFVNGIQQALESAAGVVAPESPEGVRIQTRLAREVLRKGDFDKANSLLEQASAAVSKLDDPQVEIDVVWAQATVKAVGTRADIIESLGIFDRLFALLRSNPAPSVEGEASLFYITACSKVGLLDIALERAEVGYEVASRYRDSQISYLTVGFAGLVAAAAGRWQEVDKWTSRQGAKSGQQERMRNFLVQSQQQPIDSDELVNELFQEIDLDYPVAAVGINGGFGEILHAFPDLGIEDALRRSRAISDEVYPAVVSNPAVRYLAAISAGFMAVALQDREAAEEPYKLLVPRNGLEIGLSTDRVSGLLARLLDDPAAATDHFEDALTFCRDSGYLVQLAWTCSDYAEMLLDRAESASSGSAREVDYEKAIKLQDEALVITQELGMRPLTERILARREILRA